MGRVGNWFKNAWGKIKGVGKKVIGTVGKVVSKVIPIAKKIAPAAGALVSKIPHPAAQAIGRGLQVAGGIANAVGG